MLDFNNKHDVVVDLSHNNANINFEDIEQAGILAVIHKASQGSDYVDTKFASRISALQNSNLLYGAYCFLDGDANPIDEAGLFLDQIPGPTDNPKSDTLDPKCKLFVDFESNLPGQRSATLAQCEDFVKEIFKTTNSYPVLYIGLTTLKYSSRVLSNCDLWLAKYGPAPTFLPKGFQWEQLKLWQHTDGMHGPDANPISMSDPLHAGKITPAHVDRSYWLGNKEDLVKWWVE